MGRCSVLPLVPVPGRSGRASLLCALPRAWLEAQAQDAPQGLIGTVVRKALGMTGRKVTVRGLDDVLIALARCCNPVQGDEVIGYITRGRGVTVHRRDCPNVLNLPDLPERRIVIDWDDDGAQRFLVRIVMEGTDRHGLFADIAKSISDTGTNIQSADIKSTEGGMTGQFVVEVENLAHLKKVMRQIRRVKGVISVERKESFGDSDLTLEV